MLPHIGLAMPQDVLQSVIEGFPLFWRRNGQRRRPKTSPDPTEKRLPFHTMLRSSVHCIASAALFCIFSVPVLAQSIAITSPADGINPSRQSNEREGVCPLTNGREFALTSTVVPGGGTPTTAVDCASRLDAHQAPECGTSITPDTPSCAGPWAWVAFSGGLRPMSFPRTYRASQQCKANADFNAGLLCAPRAFHEAIGELDCE